MRHFLAMHRYTLYTYCKSGVISSCPELHVFICQTSEPGSYIYSSLCIYTAYKTLTFHRFIIALNQQVNQITIASHYKYVTQTNQNKVQK